MEKPKAEIFDINSSKDEQRAAEMRMTGAERLVLVLDLMDLSAALSKYKPTPSKDDGVEWIELEWKQPSSERDSV